MKNFSTKFWNTVTRGCALSYFLNYIWSKYLIIIFQKQGKIVTLELEYQTKNKNKVLKDLDNHSQLLNSFEGKLE